MSVRLFTDIQGDPLQTTFSVSYVVTDVLVWNLHGKEGESTHSSNLLYDVVELNLKERLDL